MQNNKYVDERISSFEASLKRVEDLINQQQDQEHKEINLRISELRSIVQGLQDDTIVLEKKSDSQLEKIEKTINVFE